MLLVFDGLCEGGPDGVKVFVGEIAPCRFSTAVVPAGRVDGRHGVVHKLPSVAVWLSFDAADVTRSVLPRRLEDFITLHVTHQQSRMNE